MGGRAVRLALAGMFLAAAAADGQELSLARALERAAEHSFPSRIAAADRQAREGQAGQTRRAFLPSLRFDAGYVLTTDPLGAFGALLRRREVTAAAFDPASLNAPEAIGLLSSAVVLEQPLINVDAWYARQGARRGVAASAASQRWTEAGSQALVVRAYYAAVLAREQVQTLDDAAVAARAHLRQAESMHRNGQVTQSDVLLARVRASEVESQLIAARGAVAIARLSLALAMGSPGDTAFTLPAGLPSSVLILQFARGGTPAEGQLRADVEAARLMEEMAIAEHRRASAQLLPRINAFGRLDWHSPDALLDGPESWTVGVMVSWSPFTGGSEWAQRSAAKGVMLGARAEVEAAEAQGALELAQASTALQVALDQMLLLDTAVTQSREAHRIVRRKYDGGLATLVELFDAAALETATRTEASRARYDAIVALAERRRASGHDLAALTSLEERE